MKRVFVLGLACALPIAARAQFFDNFDTNSTGNWIFNSTVANDLRNDGVNGEVDFFFDYGIVGIPSAPNSVGGTTRGMLLQANVFGTATGVFSGVSVSPFDGSFTGDYILTFDAWQNFQGPFPGGGNGTTQMTMAGIGTTGTVAQFPGTSIQGVAFGATGDGGSAQDYRAYNAVGAPFSDTSGVYAAGNTTGSTNNTNAYYSSFRGSVPTAQTDYANNVLGFGNQFGNTNIGVLGMAWHTWRIEKNGATVTWHVDGRLIATVTDDTYAGSNIFLGYFDTNAGVSTDPHSRQLLFGLVDNVQVQAVPEPGTMAVLGMGALALLRRRRAK